MRQAFGLATEHEVVLRRVPSGRYIRLSFPLHIHQEPGRETGMLFPHSYLACAPNSRAKTQSNPPCRFDAVGRQLRVGIDPKITQRYVHRFVPRAILHYFPAG
jgi:hypothetical protein